jgi:hypothetical protein
MSNLFKAGNLVLFGKMLVMKSKTWVLIVVNQQNIYISKII